MKLPVVIVLLVAISEGAKAATPKKKKEESKTEKRDLVEGNAGVVTVVSTTASPGIVYADSTESHSEKSPSQQIYATPVPQLSKISDVLTGQGSSFPAAIANHLFSPVSVYQQRFPAPNTYEVPVPLTSQLTYTDPRTAYASPQNAAPFTYQQPFLNVQVPKQNNHRIPFNNQAPFQSFIRIYPQQQQQFSQTQLLQGVPQYKLEIPSTKNVAQPIYYYTNSEVNPQNYVQQPFTFHQGHNNPNFQNGITYASQGKSFPEKHQETGHGATVVQQIQAKPQGAISFASFSQNYPSQPAQHQFNQRQFVPVKLEPATNVASLPFKPLPNVHQQISFFRPGPLLPPFHQSIIQQPLIYSKGDGRSLVYNPLNLPIAQTAAQYYGKIAQPAFG